MILASLLGQIGSWALVAIGVGLLIFIHEMGHFLVAKWAGVRVLAFSLGFGPEMIGRSRGGTRYRIGWLPLGGYVKMSGEVELPEGGYAPDDYPAQPVGRRALIIVAGVVMNALLAFVLFAAALLYGLPAITVGAVRHGGPAWEAGIRSGDNVLRVGETRVLSFSDLPYATMQGDPVDFEVERDGRVFTVRLQPGSSDDQKMKNVGITGDPGRRLEVLPGSAAETAGFRDGDEITAIAGLPASLDDLYAFDPLYGGSGDVLTSAVAPPEPLVLAIRNGGATRELSLPATMPGPDSKRAPRIGILALRTTVDLVRAAGPAERAGWKAGDRPVAVGGGAVRGRSSFLRAVLGPARGASAVQVARGAERVALPLPAAAADRLELLRDLRFADPESPTAVEVDEIGPPGPDGGPAPSPAEAAGIPNGARITSVGGAVVAKFEDIVAKVRKEKGAPVEFAWALGKETGKAVIAPVPYPVHDLASLDLAPALGGEPLRSPGLMEIPGLAAQRCVVTTRNILATVAGIFKGRVDKSDLGGPILIAQVAHRGTQTGAGHFLWFLAEISINLMFLNVLPVPLLDGGQLALLGVEAVTKKAPSENLVGISQMVGLVLLLGLMVMVTYNDIARLLH